MEYLELKTPYSSIMGKEYYQTLTFHPIDTDGKIYLCIDKTEDIGMAQDEAYNLSIDEAKQIIDYLQAQISKK